MKIFVEEREYRKVFIHRSEGGLIQNIETGIIIPEYSFIKGRHLVGDNDYIKSLNSRIDYIIDRLKKREELFIKYTQYIPEGNTHTVATKCLHYVNMMKRRQVKSSRGEYYSPSSIRLYEYAALLLSYMPKPIWIHVYDTAGLSSKTAADATAKFNRRAEEFISAMEKNGLSKNSIANVITAINAMTSFFNKKDFTRVPLIDRVRPEEKPIVTVSDDFIKSFVRDDNNLYDTMSPEFKCIWEVSAIIMITSLRISDAVSLTETNFTWGKDKAFLIKKNGKTGSLTEMPLPSSLSSKLFNNWSTTGSIYSFSSTQDVATWVRKHFSDFFKMYEEMSEEILIQEHDGAGGCRNVRRKLYEIIHPHMLRKSAITSMLANGVSEDHVKFCSGHKPNSKSFERYKGFVERRYKSEVNDYQNKMFE